MSLLNKEKLQSCLTSFPATLGLLAYTLGLLWFLLLSQNELNYETYMSENALLVGQVLEKFDNADRMRRYQLDLDSLYAKRDIGKLRKWLAKQFDSIGLEVYEQNFTFTHPILYPLDQVTGTNLYAIMRSPSGGRLETLLLTVPLRTECSESTNSPCLSASVSLILSLLEVLRGQVYWAKDIVVVFPESDYIGLSAWLEAYHGSSDSQYLSWTELQGRSGAIQAGLNLEFSKLDADSVSISSEGINGLLANLDLVNTAVRLLIRHSIEPVVNGQVDHIPYEDMDTRLGYAKGLVQAVWTQASGSPSGLHGLLINYQIPAVTLRGPITQYSRFQHAKSAVSLGKSVEGILRSLNNLQERLHQSFWNYLLPNPLRYISIGVYMPPVMTLIGSLLIKIISFWWLPSTTEQPDKQSPGEVLASNTKSSMEHTKPVADPDQTVKKRSTRSKQVTNAEQEEPVKKTSGEQSKLSQEEAIPATLTHLAIWIALCFLGGVGLCYSATLIFHVYQHPYRTILEEALNMQPFISEFLAWGLLFVFGVIIIIGSPLLTRVLQSYLITEPVAPRRWSSSIILTGWTLFLACGVFLNVSASLIVGIIVIPPLLIFVQSAPRPKWLSFIFGLTWLAISPPVLLFLACLPYFNTPGLAASPITFSVEQLWTRACQLLTQLVLEADLLGSWTWPALTVGFCSLWSLTWTDLCCLD